MEARGFHYQSLVWPRLLAACFGVLLTTSAAISGPVSCGVDNVVADWSDDSNPSGQWSYRAGTVLLPHVDGWQRTHGGWSHLQPGWAKSEDGTDRIPFWFRSRGAETFERDFQRCDVVVHSRDDTNGIGNGEARLTWTSPGDATVSIVGGVWMGRDIGRSNDWMLLRNDNLLTKGHVASGDIYSRSSPFDFGNGDGGEAAIDGIEVKAGDTINLVIAPNGGAGDFVGVKMRVICGSAPASTTTTTMPVPDCGDAVTEASAISGGSIKASDALHILRAAVGVGDCDPCVCDVNDNGSIVASDALAVLRAAVGQPVALSCPSCAC